MEPQADKPDELEAQAGKLGGLLSAEFQKLHERFDRVEAELFTPKTAKGPRKASRRRAERKRKLLDTAAERGQQFES